MSSHEIWYIVISYLMGSIPFGFILYYLSERKDIRGEGSGNIGATNVMRNKGKAFGIATLLLDVAKGAVPVLYGFKHFQDDPTLIIIGGAAAIIGHIFPVFLKFKGGKGVATLVGVFITFSYPALLVFLGFFVIVVWISRMVSLGSIIGTASIFFYTLFTNIPEVAMVVLVIVVLIIAKHSANIKRMIAGEEHKFSWKKNG